MMQTTSTEPVPETEAVRLEAPPPREKPVSVMRSGTAAMGLKLGGRVAAYVFALVITRTAGAEAWGQLSLALAFIALGTILALAGFDTATVKLMGAQGPAAGAGQARRLFRRVAGLTGAHSLVVAAVAWLLAPVIAEHVFEAPESTSAFRLAALAIVPYALVEVVSSSFRGLHLTTISVLIQQVLRLVVPLAIYLGLYLVYPVSPVEAYVVGVVVLLGVSLAAFFRRFPASGDAPPQAESAFSMSTRELYLLGLPLLLASSMGYFKGWADTVMVGIYLTEAEVGVYDICFKLASAISIPLWGASTIAAPMIARAHAQGDANGMTEVAGQAAALATALSVPIAAVLLLAPTFVLGLFGAEFVAGAASLRWLTLGYLLNAFAGVGGVFMTMSGLHKAYQFIVFGSTLVSVLLNLYLIPLLGIEGAAASTALGLLLFNAGAIWLIRRELGVWVTVTPGALLHIRSALPPLRWNR